MSSPPPWRAPRPLPDPLTTDRTVVRFFEDGDAASLQEAVAASRASLLPWLPWAAGDHRTEDESARRIRAFARAHGFAEATNFVLGIFDRDGGQVLGGTGLHRIDIAHASADVGYWIREDGRRRGLCTEAVRALVGSAFADWSLRRITITCDGANVASRGVPERLGLRREACFEKSRWVDTVGWNDKLVYAVRCDEWPAEDE